GENVTKRKNKTLVIIAVIVAVVFLLAMIMPIVFAIFSNETKDITVPRQANNNRLEKDDTQNNEAKYFTRSTGGNVDIGVIFMNPNQKTSGDLVFKVMINTHSVDLSKYNELSKYVELRTNETIIKDQFIWDSESSEGHHVNGILKVKKQYNGKPVLGDKTEYMKLVFKEIAGVPEREHVYTKETLR
ncbi:MAG: hypothetical protein AB7G87_07395, partial [Clostridia bacterium]